MAFWNSRNAPAFPSIKRRDALMEEMSALREVVAEQAEQIRRIKGTQDFKINMGPSTGLLEPSGWLNSGSTSKSLISPLHEYGCQVSYHCKQGLILDS